MTEDKNQIYVYPCKYEYDPAKHDGVAFEDLPDDWKCPRCKRYKDKFKPKKEK